VRSAKPEEFDREAHGFPPYDASEVAEFYSCCEHCGRVGSDGKGPQFNGDTECEICLPVRERVAWREIAWIVHWKMVKLGRLPDPFPMLKRSA